MAYTAQQIIDLVNKGAGPTGMHSGSDQAAELAALHITIALAMKQLQSDMGEKWQGDAAGQAYAGAGPLIQASQVSGDHLEQAQDLYTGQGSSFSDLQNKVAAVGNLGTKPSDDMFSDTPFSFLSNRAAEIDAYNQKSQQVVDGYGVYHAQSTDNSGRWAAPSNYGDLNLPPAGGDIKAAPSTVGGPGTGNTGASGHVGGPPGGSHFDHNDAGIVGGGHGGPQSGGPGGSGGQQPGAPGSGGPAPVHAPALAPGKTSTASYVPPPSSSGGFGNQPPAGYSSSGGFGPGAGGAGSSDFGPGAGGFGGGFGSVGGSGGSGSSVGGSGGYSGGSGSSAGELGAGKGSGAGSMGGEPGNARPGGGPVSGTTGRPGTPGPGGMGRGGKTEREEDAEHHRPDYLLEPDPENALIGDLPRTAPPVIGL
jgi:hypothetical protein